MASYFGFRGTSSSASHSTASGGSHLDTSTPRSMTPSSPSSTPVNLGEILLANNQDPLTALAHLVTQYNTLLASSAANSSQSVQSERDKLSAENAKLWGWCSNSKRELDRAAKDTRDARHRVSELEGMLRANGIPTPPPRSLSTSPVDELNLPSRPRPSRSFSDEPSRAGTPSSDSSARRHPRSPNGTFPSSLSENALAHPQPTSPVSFPMQDPSSLDSEVPVATPTTARPAKLGSVSRKASSLDLGKKGGAAVLAETRSKTPPPASPSIVTHLDGAHSTPKETDSDGHFDSLPSMPPMSPLWPGTPSRSDSVPKDSVHGSPTHTASISRQASAAPVVEASVRQRTHSETPVHHHASGSGPNSHAPLSVSPDNDLPARQVEMRTSFSQLRGGHRERRPPTLQPPMLSHLALRVTNSSIRSDLKGREMVSFTIQVSLSVPPEHEPQGRGGTIKWHIEKNHADVLLLDGAVRAKNSKSQTKKIAPVPDKSMFKDHAPSKVDQRKIVLQAFLTSLVSTSLQERAEICSFFNSNVVSERNVPIINPAHKTGHLTKKGRSFGGWQTRYYVLNGPALDYYENQGGPHLGSINLAGAQIGRQQSSEVATPDSYRHAFLIRERLSAKEAKNAKQEDHDHILCAESDSERDEWVRVLAAWYTGEYVEPTDVTSMKQSIDRPSVRSFDTERPSTDSRRLAHKESRDESERLQGSKSSDYNSSSSYGHHGRQQSFGQASNASMGDNGEHHRHYVNGLHRQAHLHDISSSSSAPSALNELGVPSRSANVPPTVVERPASSNGHHSEATPPMHSHARMASYDSAQLSVHDRRQPHSSSDSNHRPMSPERKRSEGEHSSSGKKGISGPKNAVPIGDGQTFKHTTPTRKDGEGRQRVKSSFWTFARDRREAPGPMPTARPVFGISLADTVAIARIRDDFELPAVVYRCIEYLEAKNAQTEEGIYRLSGSTNVIKQLKERFNHEGDLNLLGCGDYFDVHAISGLLKLFLRELPDHILTRELQPHFFSVSDEPDRAAKVNKLGLLIGQLPTPNYTLLRFLTAHLIHVVQNENLNKMSLRNVGIVFSPTLQVPAPLFSLLLTEFDLVFAMAGDQPAPGRLDQPADEAELSPTVGEYRPRRRSRNSVIYEASGADQLLELGIRLQAPAEEDEVDTTVEEFADAHESHSTAEDELDQAIAAREHAYQEKGKGLQVNTVNSANGHGLPASPRSPLQSGQSSPQNLRIPGAHLPPSPRHAQRV